MKKIIFIIALLAGACSPGGKTGSTALDGTAWVLARMGPIRPQAEITLQVDSTRIGGTGGCNSYGGTLNRLEDGAVEVGTVESTLIGCDDPRGEQERVYFGLLRRARAYELRGDSLQLEVPGSDTTLVFVRQR